MEVESEASCPQSSASGGSREYKVVMLGAGGVGKSGKFHAKCWGWGRRVCGGMSLEDTVLMNVMKVLALSGLASRSSQIPSL